MKVTITIRPSETMALRKTLRSKVLKDPLDIQTIQTTDALLMRLLIAATPSQPRSRRRQSAQT